MKTQWIFSYEKPEDIFGAEWFPNDNPYCTLVRDSDWEKIDKKLSKDYNILDYAIVIFKRKMI